MQQSADAVEAATDGVPSTGAGQQSCVDVEGPTAGRHGQTPGAWASRTSTEISAIHRDILGYPARPSDAALSRNIKLTTLRAPAKAMPSDAL
jgi:hypothetical protein